MFVWPCGASTPPHASITPATLTTRNAQDELFAVRAERVGEWIASGDEVEDMLEATGAQILDCRTYAPPPPLRFRLAHIARRRAAYVHEKIICVDLFLSAFREEEVVETGKIPRAVRHCR